MRVPLVNEYAHIPAALRRRMNGNPAPIKRDKDAAVIRYARMSLDSAGQMIYTEGLRRGQLFRSRPGQFRGKRADCSQFVAAIFHWCGCKIVTDADYTGTLWNKGKVLPTPQPGCLVIFGKYPGLHAAIYVDDETVIGFGEQSAPDSSTLAGISGYFGNIVRYVDLWA